MPISSVASSTSTRGRFALGAILTAAALALGGCSMPSDPANPPDSADPQTRAAPAVHLYEAPESGFAITFPGEPMVQSMPVPGTDLTMNMIMYVATQTQATFAAQAFETPAEAGEIDLGESMAGALDGAGTGMTATGPTQEIELAGLPALRSDVDSELGEGALIVALDGRMLYQLMAFGGAEGDRQAYFDSFTLIG